MSQTSVLPPECQNDDNHLNGEWRNWETQMGKCYTKLKERHDSEVEAKYKEQYEKKEKTLYSGTSVATGSIGAGAGGLACGLGLFPCLVKLVSKFR